MVLLLLLLYNMIALYRVKGYRDKGEVRMRHSGVHSGSADCFGRSSWDPLDGENGLGVPMT